MAVATLCGCASAEDAPTDSTSQPGGGDWYRDLPNCSEVWIGGNAFPKTYEGCVDGDEFVSPSLIDCPDSDEHAVKFNDFIGIPGGEIVGGDPDTTTVIHC
jgi:hypothetical protein